MASRWAASQTALSVSSNPGTTLVWRIILIVDPGERVEDMSDGVLGRGGVSRPRSNESSVAASSSLSPRSLLLRLFGRFSRSELSMSSSPSKGRFLLSSAPLFSSRLIVSSSLGFVQLSMSPSPFVSEVYVINAIFNQFNRELDSGN